MAVWFGVVDIGTGLRAVFEACVGLGVGSGVGVMRPESLVVLVVRLEGDGGE